MVKIVYWSNHFVHELTCNWKKKMRLNSLCLIEWWNIILLMVNVNVCYIVYLKSCANPHFRMCKRFSNGDCDNKQCVKHMECMSCMRMQWNAEKKEKKNQMTWRLNDKWNTCDHKLAHKYDDIYVNSEHFKRRCSACYICFLSFFRFEIMVKFLFWIIALSLYLTFHAIWFLDGS